MRSISCILNKYPDDEVYPEPIFEELERDPKSFIKKYHNLSFDPAVSDDTIHNGNLLHALVMIAGSVRTGPLDNPMGFYGLGTRIVKSELDELLVLFKEHKIDPLHTDYYGNTPLALINDKSLDNYRPVPASFAIDLTEYTNKK